MCCSSATSNEVENPIPILNQQPEPTTFKPFNCKPCTDEAHAFRDKDRVHLRDMISVGMIDSFMAPAISPSFPRAIAGIARRPGRLTTKQSNL